MSVLTFLFTDIEGSTRRWEADPDVMRVALEAHNATLREAVAAHDGEVFNYTGDGMCAVFSSPRAAVDAAIDAQRALELPVRMGIATGEAELRGDDYFGTVLNRTARVMAAGHGGQILVDGATGGLLGGVDLIPLGSRRLRDIAKPVDVFQAQADGLRTDFPPLKTLDATPGNLRPPTTSFVGREPEVCELETLLKGSRLVTLTGVGGVGKTRLALEVAARLVPDFPDGVWVIELAPVADPAAVPEAVAAVLGINQQPGLSIARSVAAALESRIRLLVFDNCEHVLDAVAEMIDLILSHSKHLRILATSREGLRVREERLWPVPSLDVHSSAAELFVERASAVLPALNVQGDADTVIEICRRLDGIPLAIELAASRLLSMTVTELRDHLDDRFRLLVGSRRGLERHQTLRAAVQWSFDLLGGDEQMLLTQSSVFAGGFDVDAAQAVANMGDTFVTLDLLEALVRKSLLVADQTSGRTRFSMLETIRQFAEEQLVASGRAEETRAAHARYFAGREVDVLAMWDGPRQRQAHDWLIAELPNLRNAFRWAADRGDIDTAVTIAFLATFLGYWVAKHESIAWVEEIIEPARAAEHPRLAALYVLAAQCGIAGRIDDFRRYGQAALSAIESGRYDDVPDAMDATLHGVYMMADPVWCAERCRTLIAREPESRPFTRHSLVFALTIAGLADEALAAADGLLAAAEATDNPHLRSAGLLAYGFAYRDADPATAYDVHHRGLAIAHESGNQQVETVHALSLARIAANHRDPIEAFDYLTLSIRNYYDSGSFYNMSAPFVILAVLLGRLGHDQSAATIAGFVVDSDASAVYPEITSTIAHLRDVLGDDRYKSCARTGRAMSDAGMATYALEQIDRARAQLSPPGGSP
jgi:predicted ATPase